MGFGEALPAALGRGRNKLPLPCGERQDLVSEWTLTDGLQRCEEAGRVQGEMRDEIGFFSPSWNCHNNNAN